MNRRQACPYCHVLLEPSQVRTEIPFECPNCRATLRLPFNKIEPAIRNIVLLGVTLYYVWRHGWDHGFVIFYLGFYAMAGLLIYLFIVAPFIPVRPLVLVAPPVTSSYVDVKPRSAEEYDESMKKLRPIGMK